MSIERIYGKYHLICGICGEASRQSFGSFGEAVDSKREIGWTSQKRGGEWQDVCPECQDQELL